MNEGTALNHPARGSCREVQIVRRYALQKDTEEWEDLLETFFNLGGRLEA
jgi:hypothetical protein